MLHTGIIRYLFGLSYSYIAIKYNFKKGNNSKNTFLLLSMGQFLDEEKQDC